VPAASAATRGDGFWYDSGVTAPALLEDRALRRAMRRSERAASLSTVGMLRRELGVLGAAAVLADVLGQRLRGARCSPGGRRRRPCSFTGRCAGAWARSGRTP